MNGNGINRKNKISSRLFDVNRQSIRIEIEFNLLLWVGHDATMQSILNRRPAKRGRTGRQLMEWPRIAPIPLHPAEAQPVKIKKSISKL